MISKLVAFVDAILTVSRFYRIPLDETITNKYLLVSSFLLFRVTNPLFGNTEEQFKNNLRLKSLKN